MSASTNGQSLRKVIDHDIDLGGRTIHLDENTILSFSGQGIIRNGTVFGRSCRIESDSIRPLFQSVTLEGSWAGTVYDTYFYRDISSKQDWQIVSNVMKFNEVFFQREIYFLNRWKSILMNSGDIIIHGNGVRLFLPSDKGETRHTIWGRRYNEECILSSQTSGHRIEINDLTFSDTDDIITGYGSDVYAETPVLYYYLAPTQSEIILNRVNSNGQGTLLEIYNYRQNISRIELNGCHVSTSQFAIEIANVERDDDIGHLDLFKIDSCYFYRYPNAVLCGPVSVVGRNGGVDSVSITHSQFYESNAGNIEISGVEHAVFSGNTCYNLSFYDGDRPPLSYICTNNTFNLGRLSNEKKSRALSMGGKQLFISGNTYNILSKPYPFTELLQPEKVDRLEMTGNVINYIPGSNPKGFSCLFSIKHIKGDFLFSDNKFFTSFPQPEMDCLFPKKYIVFDDPFDGKVRINWQ